MPTQQTVISDSNGYPPQADHDAHNKTQDKLQGQDAAAVPSDRPTDLAGDLMAVTPTTPAVPRHRFPGLAVLVLGTGVLLGGAVTWHGWRYLSTHETTDDAQLQGHIYAISSRVPGTIERIFVTENHPVQAGDVLVQLDSHDAQVKVQQAQAALLAAQRQTQAAQASVAQAGTTAQAQTTTAQGSIANATATIANAQAALTVAKTGVAVAQAEVRKAEATLQKASSDYHRAQLLYKEGAISEQECNGAQQAYEVASAQVQEDQEQVRQAQAKLTQAQHGVSQAQAQLQTSQGTLQQAQASQVQTRVNRHQFQAAQAQIAQAQADLKAAQLQLKYTTIVAPVAGIMGHKTAEVGQQIQTGQPLMAVVGQEFWVEANFKETQVAHLHPGDPVEIQVDALPGHSLRGEVESFAPASGAKFALLPPDNATGNFTKVVQRIPVRIRLDRQSFKDLSDRLAPGLSVTVTVETQQP